ncbi:hypothetical protein ACMXYR_05265 [Neptuniibacter sp. QD29_5]|uniref:hypothetical protein n=1 Tax=unclassified Neptuniibacter TaxID=2630693 RepID=UPI0039F6751A
MKKLFISLLLGCSFLVVNKAAAAEQPDLLIKLQRDIFTEMIRSHGPQIENQTVLNWCQHNDLADEIGLTVNGLKRAVYDSFIVAGSQNVQATEIARQMSDDEWDLYNNALFSDIRHYRTGIKKGLEISLANKPAREKFCKQAEQQAMKTAQTITH